MTPTMSVAQLQTTAAELVENILILEPAGPPEILATQILAEADPVFVKELERGLMVRFFTTAIRAKRAGIRRAAHPKPEGMELLPLRIRVPGVKGLVPLPKMTLWHAERFYREIQRRTKDRARNSRKLLQAKALVDTLKKPAKKGELYT